MCRSDAVDASQLILPPNRLGQLLSEKRLERGIDLEQLARSSDFTVGELADIEAGHRLLGEELISKVTALYSVETGPVIPQRSRLIVDLDDRRLRVADHEISFDVGSIDHILDRYLSMVYVMRSREPGTAIPLRLRDVAVLAQALSLDEEYIIDRLEAAMRPDSEPIRDLVDRFRRQIWVPGAGVLVGMVSLGSLVMLGDTQASAAEELQLVEPDPEPEPEPEPEPSPIAIVSKQASPTLPEATTAAPTTEETTEAARTTEETTEATPTTEETTDVGVDAPQPEDVDVETMEPADVALTPSELGAEAEELLSFKWQEVLPGWTVEYLGPRSGHRGLAFPYEQRVEIYVRDSDTAASLAVILSHELGHAVDVEYLTDADRFEWMRARGIDSQTWWPYEYLTDFHTGAGDFAEAFAFRTSGDPSTSQAAGPLTEAQLSMVDAILQRAMR